MQSVDTAVTDLASATKKFFRRVLPIMLVMLVCNQLNRSNIGYAQDHLQADVGIGAAAYGFGAGLFFIAYAIFELPSNVMMEKFGAKIWLTRIMISWGIVSFLMVFVQNETMFYVLRFLLGAAEAGFFPAVIFYFARWVPAGQRGKATAVFIAGSSVAAALSGPIAGVLLSLHDVAGLRGWQWLFGFEGLLSVTVGMAVFFVLDARIQDAKWLTAGEKSALAGAIDREDAQHSAGSGDKVNRWKMLLNPQILLLCGIYFSVQLSIYANTFWLPSIVKQIPGTTDLSVGFLSAIPWVCAVFAMYFAAKWQDKAKSKRPLLVVALLVAAVGTFAAAVATPVLALVFLAVAAMGFKSASPLFWTIPQSGLHPLVLAPAIAIINSLGNLGGFVAPFGFGIIKEQTGSVVPGLFALAAASTVAAGLVYFLKERKAANSPDGTEARPEGETPVEANARPKVAVNK
ncbi:Putative tartrate transporter [Arthrobacter sp. Bi83]|jgi:MFS family permease|uniref:MFS transporter n=1 Tax=Arthrobacter sp. Bi83 TaxID=2822353 RepID=UPI001D845EA8|nr:MFS transporter [Arthrobacter sp. Bi83]CAH0278977.1 Putative tartrate transporter [Arthrobacter sp. Bi83]